MSRVLDSKGRQLLRDLERKYPFLFKAKTGVFAGVEEKALEAIFQHERCEIIERNGGVELFSVRFDPTPIHKMRYVYVVLEGQVRIFSQPEGTRSRSRLLSVAEPGTIVGEVKYVLGPPRYNDLSRGKREILLRCHTRSVLLQMHIEIVENVKSYELLQNIAAQSLCRFIRRADESEKRGNADLENLRIEQYIAEWVCSQREVKKCFENGDEYIEVDFTKSYRDIARETEVGLKRVEVFFQGRVTKSKMIPSYLKSKLDIEINTVEKSKSKYLTIPRSFIYKYKNW